MNDDLYDSWMRGMAAIAVVSLAFMNAPRLAPFLECLVSDNRCSQCGYRNDHPFIRHAYPWNGHREPVSANIMPSYQLTPRVAPCRVL